MKKCKRHQIQTDRRHTTPSKTAGTVDKSWPAEWVGHVTVNGREVSYDGVVVGVVYKVCAGWVGITADGTRKRALSHTEIIRRVLPEGAPCTTSQP